MVIPLPEEQAFTVCRMWQILSAHKDCKETIQNLILQCASKRYEKEKSQKHITDRLKADFEKSSPLSVFDAEFFSKTVTAVLLTKNGAVSLLLKNGNIIGKEKNKNVSASSDNA